MDKQDTHTDPFANTLTSTCTLKCTDGSIELFPLTWEDIEAVTKATTSPHDVKLDELAKEWRVHLTDRNGAAKTTWEEVSKEADKDWEEKVAKYAISPSTNSFAKVAEVRLTRSTSEHDQLEWLNMGKGEINQTHQMQFWDELEKTTRGSLEYKVVESTEEVGDGRITRSEMKDWDLGEIVLLIPFQSEENGTSCLRCGFNVTLRSTLIEQSDCGEVETDWKHVRLEGDTKGDHEAKDKTDSASTLSLQSHNSWGGDTIDEIKSDRGE